MLFSDKNLLLFLCSGLKERLGGGSGEVVIANPFYLSLFAMRILKDLENGVKHL